MINSNPTFCLARGKVFNRFDTKNPSRPCNINPVVQGALSKADSVQFQVDDTKVSRKEKFSILAGLGVPGTIIVAAKVTAV
ncbi:MAG: hypothetical protein KAR79_01555, partial [Simkaniaceae bacterium]|nr:hypothetical protein [Simkaniaceae bacterium]